MDLKYNIFLCFRSEEFSGEVDTLETCQKKKTKQKELLKPAIMLTPLTPALLTADKVVSFKQPKLDFKSPSAPQSGRQEHRTG